MKLKKLLKDLDVEVKGSREIEVTGISSHSQFIAPGSLFIAKKGKTFDGSEFIPKAIETGAVAVLTDFFNPFLQGIVQIITPNVNKLEALLAKRYYETERHPLYLVGITGTNGKTTTAYLIHHLLANFGLMGTIETIIGKQRFNAQLTTADVVTNHKTLREMTDQGLKGVVMEVTSHALDQNRVGEIQFDMGIFTNLSQDHLDYHGTMDEYFKAKLKLFENCKEKIYNIDDPRAKAMQGGVTFGIHSTADLQAKNIHFSLEGTTFDLQYNGKTTPIKTSLIGEYNVYNVLAALAVGLKKGERLSILQKRLTTFPGVPGRLERIENSKGFHLFVDFAHTPEALSKVLETLHALKTGRIITIFGCGGERDQDKRPKMGAAAEKYSDQLIITSDNPRSEEPEVICREIAAGLSKEAIIEVDRKAAIERGIFMAKENDLVLIAGRGHEPFQKIKGRLLPFDDRDVARCISHLTSE
ncbi:MAG: UDP-N-acetylmuramoyl-L-alanyl-D-glutamate--2,6-diaminopimelate ligase [Simkaniaceae bacterium]|nr:MAG: UDP-N-acetylmuramoyl-L-alanyl-D-glutamate--2,6-diaminopimelate ligase [Simkaniaceae bacterium]